MKTDINFSLSLVKIQISIVKGYILKRLGLNKECITVMYKPIECDYELLEELWEEL